jgi:hypothetical protein
MARKVDADRGLEKKGHDEFAEEEQKKKRLGLLSRGLEAT